MGIIAFLVVVLLSSHAVRGSFRGAERVLASWLISVSIIVAASLTCGMLSSFQPSALILATVVLWIAVYLTRRYLFRVLEETRSSDIEENPRLSPWIWFLVALNVLGIILALATATFAPPRDWDSLAYHLPFVAQLLSTKQLAIYPSDIEAINAYPKAGELFTAWLVALSANRLPLALAQLLIYPVGPLSVYVGSRRLGAQRISATLAALSLLCVPIVFHQLSTAYVDVIFACVTTAAAVFATAPPDRGRSFLFLVALGLVIGTKGTGLLAALVLVVFYSMRRWRARSTDSAPISFLGLLSVFTVGVGLFWAIRNTALHGNPVHDRTFRVFGHVLFQGTREIQSTLADRDVATTLSVWLDSSGVYHYDGRIGGFGPLFAVLLLPAILVFMAKSWRRLVNPISAIVVFGVISPFAYNTRFAIAIAIAGLMALAVVASGANRWLKSILVVLAFYSAFVGWPSVERLPAHWLRLGRPDRCENDVARYFPFNGEHGSRELYTWIHENTPSDAHIALLTKPWIFEFPLWDEHFLRCVSSLPRVLEQGPLDSWPDFIIVSWDHPDRESLETLGGSRLISTANLDRFVVYRVEAKK